MGKQEDNFVQNQDMDEQHYESSYLTHHQNQIKNESQQSKNHSSQTKGQANQRTISSNNQAAVQKQMAQLLNSYQQQFQLSMGLQNQPGLQ